jgi:hypothetical protein
VDATGTVLDEFVLGDDSDQGSPTPILPPTPTTVVGD